MNKKIFLLLSLSGILSINSFAENFNWSEYKKTLPSSIIKENDLTKTERTKANIKKNLGVDVDRRTLEEIKRDQTSKSLTISAVFRDAKEYNSGGVEPLVGNTGTTEKTSQIGVSISGRFDLISIGKKMPNTYANIEVFQDNIWIGISRRIQADNRLGLFSDIGAGLFFQMNETTRKDDMYLYGYYNLGWNFEDWSIKAGINIPSDAFDDGFFKSSQYSLSIGWRF